MPDLGWLGVQGQASQLDDHDQVAVGTNVPPELSAGAVEEHVSTTAEIVFWVALAYLAVYVFHVVTF